MWPIRKKNFSDIVNNMFSLFSGVCFFAGFDIFYF